MWEGTKTQGEEARKGIEEVQTEKWEEGECLGGIYLDWQVPQPITVSCASQPRPLGLSGTELLETCKNQDRHSGKCVKHIQTDDWGAEAGLHNDWQGVITWQVISYSCTVTHVIKGNASGLGCSVNTVHFFYSPDSFWPLRLKPRKMLV